MGQGIKRNKPCYCGSGKKYKNCCINLDDKKEKYHTIKMSRADLFIKGPYKKCPNPLCLSENSFGVFINLGGTNSYTRECIKCGYRQNFKLPTLNKRVIYIDQFAISNLVKLLDKNHPSHDTISKDPFWTELFSKLENASKSQIMICPDSFYHFDESLFSKIDFRLIKRLYEHFSDGNTFYPSSIIQKYQISQHFEAKIKNKLFKPNFDPEKITFEGNLNSWMIGLHLSINQGPYPGQKENLQKVNALTKSELGNIWNRWKNEKNITFIQRVKEETLGLWKGMFDSIKKYYENNDYSDINNLFPPMELDLINDLISIAKNEKIEEKDACQLIVKYFQDVDSLLDIPIIRINSVMFAGLARRAALGQKNPPKSTVDVQFISSYLPYCDAMFIDKESYLLIKEPPQDAPNNLKLKEFSSKVYSLLNKQAFLNYLDKIISETPLEQIEILKDINGDDYKKPFWEIIEHEKQQINLKK